MLVIVAHNTPIIFISYYNYNFNIYLKIYTAQDFFQKKSSVLPIIFYSICRSFSLVCPTKLIVQKIYKSGVFLVIAIR